jgi:hypothetical protein
VVDAHEGALGRGDGGLLAEEDDEVLEAAEGVKSARPRRGISPEWKGKKNIPDGFHVLDRDARARSEKLGSVMPGKRVRKPQTPDALEPDGCKRFARNNRRAGFGRIYTLVRHLLALGKRR